MKKPDLKLKNLKETRIPCPSFRRVYTFFTYSAAKPALPCIPRTPCFQPSLALIQQDSQPTRIKKPKYLKFQKVAENSKNAPQNLQCQFLKSPPTITFAHRPFVPGVCPSFPPSAPVDRFPNLKLKTQNLKLGPLGPSQVPEMPNSAHLTRRPSAATPNTFSLHKNTFTSPDPASSSLRTLRYSPTALAQTQFRSKHFPPISRCVPNGSLMTAGAEKLSFAGDVRACAQYAAEFDAPIRCELLYGDAHEAINQLARRFGIVGGFARKFDVDRGLPRYGPVVAALQSYPPDGSRDPVEAVLDLTRDLQNKYQKHLLSASSKILWALWGRDILIYDTRAFVALQQRSPQLRPRDYQGYCLAWVSMFAECADEIAKECARQGACGERWFHERVFDSYLWRSAK
jgi:hypothetical protein